MKVHWLQFVEEMRNVSLVCHESANDEGALVTMFGRDEECLSHVS
jgi:hypothetical protein